MCSRQKQNSFRYSLAQVFGPLFGVFFDDLLSADILLKKRVFSKSDVLLKREAHF